MEGTTPPAPKIKIFLFFKLKFIFFNAFSKPSISVLCPIIFLSFKYIVFTECVFFASLLKTSKKGITAFLNGTVTFAPLIFPSLTFKIKSFKSLLFNFFFHILHQVHFV